jgi:hypothetical protein
MRIEFVGADMTARGEGIDRKSGQSNYFIGDDQAEWRTNVPHYGRVKFREVYRGIDLVFHGSPRFLEWDFIVQPDVPPSGIRMRFSSARAVTKVANGELILLTESGAWRLKPPLIYQDRDGARRRVRGSYAIENGNVTLDVGRYDRSRPLIIDPVLVYSTYLGGSSSAETAHGLAVDEAGNVYLSGLTGSLDFPVANPAQASNAGGVDAFVTKINADGSGLVYSTYLGGSGSFEEGYALGVDAEGNAYVTGETNSVNFPRVNAIQGTYAGGTDGFLTKIGPDGSTLEYSTYIGGSSLDLPLAIAVDQGGVATVSGYTSSTTLPVVNAMQPTYGGGTKDAFVASVLPDGSAFRFLTYFGGSASDESRGIAIDQAGSVYVGGDTTSSNFPTKNPLQGSRRGTADLFLAKMSGDGSELVYSTYFGGSSGDNDSNGLKLLTVDGYGNAYLTGRTGSLDFPLVNAAQEAFGGVRDVFVTKVSADGTAIMFSTYLGGTKSDDGYSIAVDDLGNVYVSGQAESTDFPMVNAIQSEYGGSTGDGFVAMLSPDGGTIVYSTYLGGISEDRANAIVVDAAGNAYVTGQTFSTDFPTMNPFQGTMLGGQDAFVAKISSVLPPGAVDLQSWSTKSSMGWNAVPGAVTYHVYRGEAVDLPRLIDANLDSCLRLSTSDITTGPVLVEAPIAGSLHWYLVRAGNANGLGSAGNATVGPRIHDPSGNCP